VEIRGRNNLGYRDGQNPEVGDGLKGVCKEYLFGKGKKKRAPLS